MGAYRQVVTLHRVSFCIIDTQSRRFHLVTELNNDHLPKSGGFIGFFLIGFTLDQVFQPNRTGEFGNDQSIERVPFAKQFTLADLLSILHEQLSTVRDSMRNQYNIRVLIQYTQLRQTSYNHVTGRSVILRVLNRT